MRTIMLAQARHSVLPAPGAVEGLPFESQSRAQREALMNFKTHPDRERNYLPPGYQAPAAPAENRKAAIV